MTDMASIRNTAVAPTPSESMGHGAQPKPVATKWTCPMHPEIVRDEPGSCPICGMTLEPMTVSANEPESAELVDMTRRFRVSTALTIPVFLIVCSTVSASIPAC